MNRSIFRSISHSIYKPWLQQSAILLLLGILYAFLLTNRFYFLRPVISQTRYGFFFVFPLVFLAFLAAALAPVRWNGFTILFLSVVFCGFALAGLWAFGKSEPSSVISGLIPYSDAARHYTDALAFLQGKEMSLFSAQRGMYAVFLSALLGLSGDNLQVSVAVVSFLAALSFFPVIRQVSRSHGALAAAFTAAAMFFYYRRFIGTTLSENMGFILANLGFALLWQAATEKNSRAALAGLFLASAGLNARPGPMFLLPLYLLWSAYFLRGKDRISWRVLGLGAAVILSAFVVNALITRQVNTEATIPFTHLIYPLYGVVHGGANFGAIALEHPELSGLGERETALASYRLIFEHFGQVPFDFALGVWKEIRMFFSNTGYNAYAYLDSETLLASNITFYGINLLALGGLFGVLKKRSEPHAGLLLAGLLGILISLPFARPSDASGMRLYAAGILPLLLLPALGLAYAAGRLPRLGSLNKPRGKSKENAAAIIGFILVALLLSLPALIKQFRQPVLTPAFTCPSGQESAVVRYARGSFIRVIPDEPLKMDWMPNYFWSRFKAQVHNASTNFMINDLEHVEPPSTLFSTINLQDGGYMVFVANTKRLQEYGLVRACGYPGAKDEYGHDSRIFFARSLSWIGP